MITAAAKLCIKRVHDAVVERSDLLVADERTDVLLRVTAVGLKRVEFPVGLFEVPVEQLVNSRVRSWLAALVHLVQQPDARVLSQLFGLGTRRDGLAKFVPPLSNRVHACVDAHSYGPARKGLAAFPAAASRSSDGPPRP